VSQLKSLNLVVMGQTIY